jgi:hypothetical protein
MDRPLFLDCYRVFTPLFYPCYAVCIREVREARSLRCSSDAAIITNGDWCIIVYRD